jgi:hypothetical protein
MELPPQSRQFSLDDGIETGVFLQQCNIVDLPELDEARQRRIDNESGMEAEGISRDLTVFAPAHRSAAEDTQNISE